jgi:hypothetical protein
VGPYSNKINISMRRGEIGAGGRERGREGERVGGDESLERR